MWLNDFAPRPAHLRWLLDSDPSIRWQVMRDLTDASHDAIAAERSRVATHGWGAKLLARQSPSGTWGGRKENAGLLITFYSLVVPMDLGLDPASKQARKMVDRVDKHLIFKWHSNRRFFDGETEPCINGRILALGAYFREPNDALANQLLKEQLEDGGWNCEAPKSRRSSFHTTICVLEGLLAYERAGRKSRAVTEARSGPKNICSNATCSARFGPAKSSRKDGYASPSRRSGTTMFCADSTISAVPGPNRTAASVRRLRS